MTFATSDLYDERGDALDSLSLQFHDLGGVTAFHGPVRTVRCHRDNGLVKQVLSTPGEGAVLVVAGGRGQQCPVIGGHIAPPPRATRCSPRSWAT